MKNAFAGLAIVLGLGLMLESLILFNSSDLRVILLGNMAITGGLLALIGMAFAVENGYQERLAKMEKK